MRRKIFEVRCDRCGRVIDVPHEPIGYIMVSDVDPETDDIAEQNEFEGKDFCPTCIAQIKAYITGEQTAASLGVSIEEKKDEEYLDEAEIKEILKESKPKKKPKLDIPKAQALRDAGWTVEAIAEECKVSVPTVRRWTHASEKKAAKPLEFGGGL